MARKQKKKKKKTSSMTIEPSRMRELLACLDANSITDASEAEVLGLVKHLDENKDVDRLALLESLARNKAEEKAARRSLYLLKQKGLQVPEIRREGVKLTGGDAGFPLLMAPLQRDATRLFTAAQREGDAVDIIEIYFRIPHGLYRLKAARSDIHTYKRWVREITNRKLPNGLPERVKLSGSLLPRKRWEIRRCVRQGQIGPEVDLSFAERFMAKPGTPAPPHPVEETTFSSGQELSIEAFAASPHRLEPFEHPAAEEALRHQFEELFGHDLISSGVSTHERAAELQKVAGDMFKQWGAEQAHELIMDAALFHAAVGDFDAACTLRSVITSSERSRTLETFVKNVLAWVLSQR